MYILQCQVCGTLNTVESRLWDDVRNRPGVHCASCVDGSYESLSILAQPAALAPDIARLKIPA